MLGCESVPKSIREVSPNNNWHFWDPYKKFVFIIITITPSNNFNSLLQLYDLMFKFFVKRQEEKVMKRNLKENTVASSFIFENKTNILKLITMLFVPSPRSDSG